MRITPKYAFDHTEPTTYDHIRIWWHRTRHWLRWYRTDLMLGAWLVILVIVGYVLTDAFCRFEDRAAVIMATQSELSDKCDQCLDELADMRAEVEAWPGVTEIPDQVIAPLTEPSEPAEPEPVWLTFEVTAYCPCAKCCGRNTGITASGTRAQDGITVGADWSVLPAGTVIEIEGIGIRTVEDRGGAIKGMRLDLYMDSHAAALDFGRQTLRVRALE